MQIYHNLSRVTFFLQEATTKSRDWESCEQTLISVKAQIWKLHGGLLGEFAKRFLKDFPIFKKDSATTIYIISEEKLNLPACSSKEWVSKNCWVHSFIERSIKKTFSEDFRIYGILLTLKTTVKRDTMPSKIRSVSENLKQFFILPGYDWTNFHRLQNNLFLVLKTDILDSLINNNNNKIYKILRSVNIRALTSISGSNRMSWPKWWRVTCPVCWIRSRGQMLS